METITLRMMPIMRNKEDFNDATMEAIEEINQGGGIRCNTFEEYLKAIQ